MGSCGYCGKTAGWFRSAHDACIQANRTAKTAMVDAIGKWVPDHPDVTDFSPIVHEANRLAATGFVDEEQSRAQCRDGIYVALERYLEDGVLSKLEEDHLLSAAEALGLEGEYLGKHRHAGRFVGAGVIRRVTEGEDWERPWDIRELGLILGANEQLLWVNYGLTLHEPRTSRTYVGASSGISLRVARGVYYRIGQFRGHPIDRTEVEEVAKGTLALTNQHVYFLSPNKGFKVAYRRVIAVMPFEDGIGLQRDGVSAKPQYIHGGDGWVLYNLVMNFAEVDRSK